MLIHKDNIVLKREKKEKVSFLTLSAHIFKKVKDLADTLQPFKTATKIIGTKKDHLCGSELSD